MSTTILTRIDDLGARLDELEAAVGDLAVAVRKHAHACAVLRTAPLADACGAQAEIHSAGDAAQQQR
jgi:hypothetical protein